VFAPCLSVVIEYKTLDQRIETGECHFLAMVRNSYLCLWCAVGLMMLKPLFIKG